MPIELTKIAGNVHLFKLTDALLLENINLWKNWIWDVLEVDWSDIHVTLNGKEINLPISIVIPFMDKFRVMASYEGPIAPTHHAKTEEILV